MGLTFNGNTPKNITYNGNEVKKVIYNGVVVWQKSSDTIPPTITVKTGATETIGNAVDGYSLISFKLYDNKALKEYEINGTIRPLSASQWSDINGVKVGSVGGISGNNTLIVRDTSDNQTIFEFLLIS